MIQAAWYGILFYLLSLAFSKIAILLLYIHLFTFKWARLAGQILFGIVVVTHLYMALVTFTACIPLHSYWDFTVEKKYCQPQSVWWSNTGLHMGEPSSGHAPLGGTEGVSDADGLQSPTSSSFFCPCPSSGRSSSPVDKSSSFPRYLGLGSCKCSHLHPGFHLSRFHFPSPLLPAMPHHLPTPNQTRRSHSVRTRRVCFISILRLMQLLRAQTDPDFTYAAAPLSYLTAVEINGAIVCACVMTLKPLLSKFWPRFLGLGYYSSRSRSGNNNNSGGYRGRRGSETLVNGGGGHRYKYNAAGGPPTIGSLPSKFRGPLDSLDRDVWIETRGAGGGGSRRVCVDGGYVEIEDGDSAAESWGADVELAENVGREGDGQVMMQPPPPVVVGSGIVRVDTEVRVQVSKAET